MGENSKIPWTDHTFNPWVGCTKVSAGCQRCYAEILAKRTGFAIWGDNGTRTVTSDAYWKQPWKWAKQPIDGRKPRVFCASMADVFEDRPELVEPRDRLWTLITGTAAWLDWLLLTKRPENFKSLLPPWIAEAVWLGVTAENQRELERRSYFLLETKPKVRFISAEPMLEALDVKPFVGAWPSLDWVICGSESGHGARPFSEDWARSLRDQCVAAGVPFFYKQRLENGRKVETPELDGRTWTEYPEATR